ncbi:MAG TPA: replication-relaxation family protein [Verrucomicrobiae bacterium]|nr:replication-relaxation family protein [Verrucomicrobiae bacterium]
MAGHKRTTIVLQERDLRLLEALQSMRVINREQAKVVAGFHSTRRANDRLLMLSRAGFLKRAFIGSREAVYWLPGKAVEERSQKAGGSGAEPAALFLKHRLEINRVNLLVQYCGIPVRGWWFGSWRAFQQPLSPTLPLIPDGYFELGSAAGFRPIFLEVDLGTEAVPVIAKKVNLYLQLGASGEFGQLFNRSQFRVLVITTGQRRLENLRAAVAKRTDKIFWLGTLDLLSPEKFWSTCWLRPTGDHLQSIL